MYLVPYYIGTIFFQGLILSNGQNRVHPEARWPKPGTPFHASPRAPSYWPTPAQIRLWPNLKRVHPILPNHPPIGYPISITPTRLWPGYSTSRRVIAPSRDAAGHFCGRRGRACGRTLTALCSLYMYVCRGYIRRCMHVHELPGMYMMQHCCITYSVYM